MKKPQKNKIRKNNKKTSYLIFDIIIMHCKYVIECLSDLWKSYCFYSKTNNYGWYRNIINNMWQYESVRGSYLMHVFYGIHNLTAWLGHEEGRI